jgi:hypothetical protein
MLLKFEPLSGNFYLSVTASPANNGLGGRPMILCKPFIAGISGLSAALKLWYVSCINLRAKPTGISARPESVWRH